MARLWIRNPNKVTSSILQAGSLACSSLSGKVSRGGGGGRGVGVGEEGNKISILEAEP